MDSTTFHYVEDDLIASNRRYAAHYWRRKRTRLSLAVVLLGLSALCVTLAAGRDDPVWLPALGGTLLGLLLIGTFYLLSRWQMDRYARKNFAEQRNLADEFRFSWTEEGFESTSDRGSTRLSWVDLVRWDEAGTVVMLFLAERLFVAVPKRALSAEQIASLRTCLSRALPEGRRKA